MLLALPLFAQLGGSSTYQFLNLVSSPRQAALGGKIITNFDHDVTEALYNPASINWQMHNGAQNSPCHYFHSIYTGKGDTLQRPYILSMY